MAANAQMAPPGRESLERRARSIFGTTRRLDRERYTSQAFHDHEVDRVWRRVWQMACRESDVAQPGDYYEYRIAEESVLIVRDLAGGLHALSNVCRHRGTSLKSGHGAARELRCPFHGWRYALDGSLLEVTNPWEFPELRREECGLPEFAVETWAGFVFVNLDSRALPLREHLGPLWTAVEADLMVERYRAFAVSIELRCNWKIALAAFPESYHVHWTHPQIGSTIPEAGTEFRLLGSHGRLDIRRQPASGSVDDETFLEEYLGATGLIDPDRAWSALEAGASAREVVARGHREALEAFGLDVSAVADHDLIDRHGYLIFPNLVAYTGLTSQGVTWRFRPNGSDPDSCVLELWLLQFFDQRQPRPPDAPVISYPVGTSFTEALGPDNLLGPVFDQDISNLESIQRGLRSPYYEGPLLALYEESLVRHFEDVLDTYLDERAGA